jgi:uncharacterized protein (TIGR02118 family)
MMITVSVLYPNSDGASFDHDYYKDKHIPMVAEKLGSALKGVKVERGIAGGAPGTPAPYVAIAHLSFDSVEDFQNSFGPNAQEILADIPNYTAIEATFQISEVASG